MVHLRVKVKQIIFTITLIIIALLILRILLDLVGLSNSNAFFQLIKSISDIFITPFQIIDPSIQRELSFFNFDVFISIGFYILLGILLAEICTFFLYENFKLVIINFFDILFKLFESIFILRILLDIFYIRTGGGITRIVLDFTEWSHSVTNIILLDGRIYIGTVIVLGIIIVFDYLTDAVLRALPGSNEEVVVTKTVVTQYPYQPVRR